MKQEKFKIVNLTKELIVVIEKNLDNFPKKEIEIKRMIKETSYGLLLELYEANGTTRMEKRQEKQEEIIAKIKYLDFLINQCYDKQIINGKRYLRIGEKLDQMVRYVNAWIKVTK